MTKQLREEGGRRSRDGSPRSVRQGRGRRAPRRRGATLVLFVVCAIPLVACVALAIDLGVLTFAQTQLVDAADAAALAGARTLNGNSAVNNNYSSVTPNAQAAVAANNLLGADQHRRPQLEHRPLRL